jgi:hypothetical protein
MNKALISSFEFSCPKMRIFKLELVDRNAEITVHRLIPQECIGTARLHQSSCLATQGQNLRETHIEKQPFHQTRSDQQLKQGLISL